MRVATAAPCTLAGALAAGTAATRFVLGHFSRAGGRCIPPLFLQCERRAWPRLQGASPCMPLQKAALFSHSCAFRLDACPFRHRHMLSSCVPAALRFAVDRSALFRALPVSSVRLASAHHSQSASSCCLARPLYLKQTKQLALHDSVGRRHMHHRTDHFHEFTFSRLS